MHLRTVQKLQWIFSMKLSLSLFVFGLLTTNALLAQQNSCVSASTQILPDQELRALADSTCDSLSSYDPDDIREYEHFQAGLNSIDNLIFEYSFRCYSKINSEMRKTSDYNLETRKLAEQLDLALCSKNIYQGITYRGVNLPDSVVEQHQVNQTIVLPGFTSTSVQPSIACGFTGNVFYKILSKSGRDISLDSKLSEEKEILFRLGTEFKVIKKWTGKKAARKSNCSKAQVYIEMIEI